MNGSRWPERLPRDDRNIFGWMHGAVILGLNSDVWWLDRKTTCSIKGLDWNRSAGFVSWPKGSFRRKMYHMSCSIDSFMMLLCLMPSHVSKRLSIRNQLSVVQSSKGSVRLSPSPFQFLRALRCTAEAAIVTTWCDRVTTFVEELEVQQYMVMLVWYSDINKN
jgi:hypothetical protein